MNNNIIKINKKYSYKILKKNLEKMKKEYKFFYVGSIGKSTLGRKIFFFKLGKGNKKLFINAAHHANEWMTSLIIMMFVEKYLCLYNYKKIYKNYNIEELWNKTSLYIVPMINPDGVELCLGNKEILKSNKYKNFLKKYENNLERWKSNIRGVDLNLNYPTGWEQAVINKMKKGVSSPGPRDYPGSKPLSEIETKNIINFSNKYNFDMTISLHSQGQEIYGFDKIKKCYEIGKKFEKVSGYKLTYPDFYSAFAGYKDWFIEKFNKPAYTIEIGKGEEGISLPIEKAKEVYKEMEELFFVAIEECGKL